MKSIKKSFLVMIPALLCFVLAGCGLFGGKVKDTKSLLEKAEKNKVESCHMDGTLDMKISAGTEMGNMSIPMDLDMKGDVAGEYGHMDTELHMNFLSMDITAKSEIYMDKDNLYAKTSGNFLSEEEKEEEWTVSPLKSSMASMFGVESDTQKVLEEKGKFAEEDDGYSITIDAEELPSLNSVGDLSDMDTSEMEIEEGSVIYRFDKDCVLSGMECKDVVMKQAGDGSVDTSITMNMKMNVSKVNQIKEKTCKVPADIKKSAKPKDDETTNLIPGLDENTDGDDGTDIDMGTDIDTGTGTDDGSGSTVEPENPVTSQPSGDTVYGSINGVPLVAGKNDFDATFGADGFTFRKEDDGQYSFAVMESSKYENIELSLNHQSYGQGNATEKEIRENGFYGYEINCAFCQNRPQMEWNGLTWGASADDIKAVYGEPYDTFDGDMMTTYDYKFSGQVDMTFFIYKPGEGYSEGLQGVRLSVYE